MVKPVCRSSQYAISAAIEVYTGRTCNGLPILHLKSALQEEPLYNAKGAFWSQINLDLNPVYSHYVTLGASQPLATLVFPFLNWGEVSDPCILDVPYLGVPPM